MDDRTIKIEGKLVSLDDVSKTRLKENEKCNSCGGKLLPGDSVIKIRRGLLRATVFYHKKHFENTSEPEETELQEDTVTE